MIICSLIWIVFFSLCCYRWYKSDGLCMLFDVNRIAVAVWSLGIALYDLGLSDLLHPDVLINFIAAVIVAVFLGFELTNTRDQTLLTRCFKDIKAPNNVLYWFIFAVLMLTCLFAFKTNIATGNIRGLSNNPGARIELTYGYMYRLSVPIALACYMSARLVHRRLVKWLMYLIFALFTAVTAAGLDRGPIVWLLTGIAIYELFSYAQRKGKVTISFRYLLFFLTLITIVIWAFDAFGSTRVTAQGNSSVSALYQMNVDIPDGLTWIYIYITTPLENARFALEEIDVGELTFGCKMLYPFIKLIANLVGQGDAYATWIQSHTVVYSYLKSVAGLTVGSFLLDALQDFSYLGIVLYPLAYGLMTTLFKAMLRTQWLSSFTKVIVYTLVFQETLWSIFDDTVLFGPVLVCAVFFVVMDALTTFLTAQREEVGCTKEGSRVVLDRD